MKPRRLQRLTILSMLGAAMIKVPFRTGRKMEGWILADRMPRGLASAKAKL